MSASTWSVSCTDGTSKKGVTTIVLPDAGMSAAVVRSDLHQRMPVKYSSEEPASTRRAATLSRCMSDWSCAMRAARSAAVMGSAPASGTA
jgi:hypothetical protein